MTVAATGWFGPRIAAPARQGARRRSSSFPRTVRTLLWILILFVGAEIGLRLRAWHRHGSNAPVANIYNPDPVLGRRLRGGATLEGSRRQVSINSLGFRGPEIAILKPPGTVRIAVLGDSTVFGLEASCDAAVWVERMVARLRESGSGGGFDAINAGVPGYTLAVSAEQLTRDIAPIEPDVVIVNQLTADIAAHSRRQFRSVALSSDSPSSLTKFLEGHSVLVNVFRQNTTALTAKFIPHRRQDRLDDRGFAEYADRLAHVVDTCRSRGWRIVLATCPRSFGDPSSSTDQHVLAATALANNPSLSLKGLNDAFDRYNEVIRRTARTHGVAIVDLDRLVPRGDRYFVDAVHLNDAGHDLVGRLIAEALLDGVFDEALALGVRRLGIP